MTTKIYFIEGNIGAGKSSVISYLDKHLPKDKYNIILEPIIEYRNLDLYKKNKTLNVLDEFYNKKISGFTFQVYICNILMKQIIKNIHVNKINIVERSLFTAVSCFSKNLYQMNMMNLNEFSILKTFEEMFEIYLKNTKFSFIYIYTTPETCFERMIKRNRKEESSVTLDYLQKIDKCHVDMLEELDKKNYFINYIKNYKNNSIKTLANIIFQIID